MTQSTGTQTTYTKPLAMAGTGVLALALLTGCTTAEPEAEGTPADNGATTAATATAGPETTATTPGTGTPTEDDTSTPATTPGTAGATGTTGTGDDAVFAAIDAIHAKHPDAFVVQVDREDDDSAYEIEAHLQGEILEFTVMTDGSVREDDSDQDDDHIRRARDASVTAEQAAEAALEGRSGQTVDEMELEDEDGTLVWKVELDRESGDDGDELRVDAMTGEVTQGR
jgi:uncharacterized membrane protein YkoI